MLKPFRKAAVSAKRRPDHCNAGSNVRACGVRSEPMQKLAKGISAAPDGTHRRIHCRACAIIMAPFSTNQAADRAILICTMRMSWLTRRQMVEFRRRVEPMASFLHRCKPRLQELGFTDSNELYREVDKALRALHSLYASLWESGPYSRQKRDEELPPPGDRTF